MKDLLKQDSQDFDNLVAAIKEQLIGFPRRHEIENMLEVYKTCKRIRFRNIK